MWLKCKIFWFEMLLMYGSEVLKSSYYTFEQSVSFKNTISAQHSLEKQ